MSTVDPATIALAILPPPVPPAVIRSRPPQAGIPPTKADRDSLRDAVRRGMSRDRAVPPLGLDELRRRAFAALAEAELAEQVEMLIQMHLLKLYHKMQAMEVLDFLLVFLELL